MTRFFGRVLLPEAATTVLLAGHETLSLANAALAPEALGGEPTTLQAKAGRGASAPWVTLCTLGPAGSGLPQQWPLNGIVADGGGDGIIALRVSGPGTVHVTGALSSSSASAASPPPGSTAAAPAAVAASTPAAAAAAAAAATAALPADAAAAAKDSAKTFPEHKKKRARAPLLHAEAEASAEAGVVAAKRAAKEARAAAKIEAWKVTSSEGPRHPESGDAAAAQAPKESRKAREKREAAEAAAALLEERRAKKLAEARRAEEAAAGGGGEEDDDDKKEKEGGEEVAGKKVKKTKRQRRAEAKVKLADLTRAAEAGGADNPYAARSDAFVGMGAPVGKPVARHLGGGLVVVDTVVGAGPVPALGRRVKILYEGLLAADGSVFDARQNKRSPLVFRLGLREVVPGMDKGLQGMKVGGSREIRVPAVMGYGAKRAGPIPANSDLVFKVDLIGIA